jgi:phosphoenolpyruvate carboxylase
MADAYSEYPLQPNNTTIGVVQRLLSGEPMIPGSPLSAKATADEIYDALCSQCLEIVLTAHPTEVNRRTVVRKHRAIDNALAALDGAQLWRERVAEEQNLLRQIEMLWWTDEIRRDKPTPVKEALHGLEIVASSMWHAVPAFLRRVDSELRETPGIGKPLPPDVAPVKFGSWMGGDRDGNPNVTAAVTKEVVIMSRLRGAELIHAALADLVLDMSGDAATATPALMALLPEGDAKATDRPYSFLFKTLMARLEVSADLLRAGQFRRSADPVLSAVAGAGEPANPLDAVEPLTDSGELVAALMVAYESLTEKGLLDVRNGKLVDLIRQVKCFGLGLLPLDCRNESVRHSEALAAITRFHGLGSYLDWSEEVRMNWLMRELSEKRPLLPTKGPNFESEGYRQLGPMFDETVCDTLETFDMIAQLPAESLGAYVISMSQQASDVLAVRLLQAEAGVAKPMRVVPLFETLDDLSNAPDVMKTLFSTPWYKGDIEGEQEVMLGYSDSAKDAGRLAAAWAQYTAQERLVEVAATSNVKLSLFHGKGGTVSRGGDPSTMRGELVFMTKGLPASTLHLEPSFSFSLSCFLLFLSLV